MPLLRIARLLRNTPLHPQWLVSSAETRRIRDAATHAHGRVLDIGCANRVLEDRLSASCEYVGLDFPPTAIELYGSRPDVYGDAARLPFADGVFDTVVLLEVLEHVRQAERAIEECCRVLAEDGHLVISMPFLYPVHDAPHDYQRYTIHGLRARLHDSGFLVVEEHPLGHPLTTAALLANIALAHTVLEGFQARTPAALLVICLPVAVPTLNLIGYLSTKLGSGKHFMAHGHTLLARRTKATSP